MTHKFSQIPKADIQRSTFDRSHGYKTTMDGTGYLYPIFVDEVLPGDTFNLKMNVFARLAPTVKPPMDNIFQDFFFFYVPCRLLWSHWKNFMGEKVNYNDSTTYTIPYLTSKTNSVGTIYDYMGLPIVTLDPTTNPINAMPFRAYNLIWNEWFRDENLTSSLTVDTGDGPDSTSYALKKRMKRADYFTSALPWPQKNSTTVSLPLGTSAPIERASNAAAWKGYRAGTDTLDTDNAAQIKLDANGILNDGTHQLSFHTMNGLYADLTNASAATINSLREAFQLQRMYERDARGGTRYVEMIKAHFGVTSPDFRQQRPELLSVWSERINVHPVARTNTVWDGVNDQESGAVGQLAAFSTVSSQGKGFTKSFTEHGYIIGLTSTRADLNYYQGINKMWSRRTRPDFYFPVFSHLGEQSILNKEIYTQNAAADNSVFGYQERHAEYRYKPSVISGLFRPGVNGTLDVWHLTQEFGSLPGLNESFMSESVPMDRILAVTNEPAILYDSFIELKCARPMPVYSVPGLIDHF